MIVYPVATNQPGIPLLFTFASPVLRARPKPHRVLVEEIKRKLAIYYNVPSMAMQSQRREYAWPRQIAMTLARDLTDMSYPEIGRRFANRDHTTVIHAVRKVSKFRAEDPEFDAEYRALSASLKAAR